MSTVHSRWQCPECGLKMSSPIAGTSMAHMCKKTGASILVNAKRVWSSKFDRIARGK